VQLHRTAGVLLPVASLPGECGIGSLGDEALAFLDYLAAAGQSFWQMLPVGPDDVGNPYVAQSSWAGSPFLVSLEELARLGDLTGEEVASARAYHSPLVDYAAVARARLDLLPRAARRFFQRGPSHERERFDAFCAAQASWLEDYALFAALKVEHGGQPWWMWPKPLALRQGGAVEESSRRLAENLQVQKYIQFRFDEQWQRLRAKAGAAGIKIIGDVPIYTARDSADVWAARDLFQLNADGGPRVVSGVPPDYFAMDGQRWGTPIYDWKKHKAQGFEWWIGRMKGALRIADVVRIDHFRAFESYWEIPASSPTAREGRWVEGPGDDFFAAVRKSLGDAPFIAEDLGIITRAVRALRDRWELPGMRVLQFAFGEGAQSPHLPIYHVRNSIVYTGTHDNDTTVGWYQKASEREKDMFRRYTASDGSFCHYHMMRAAYASVADLAIVPIQDVLGLGSEARVNVPGVVDGNWRFKLIPGQLNDESAWRLRELAETFGRLPGSREAKDEEAVAA
jgi:4-alpha-glucanotransferase